MAVDVIARALAARADSKSETAYGYAVEGGYTGTEQQFGEDLGQIGNNAQVMSNAVRFDEAQSKSDAEKEQAQSNIGLDVALGDIDAQIANKANPDGLYESLTTGYTYNFTSDTFIVDKEPYNYRTAGGSADVGDREDVETLVGGTLALNQLIPSNAYPTETKNSIIFTNNNGIITASGTATAYTAKTYNATTVAQHIYLLIGSPKATNEEYGISVYPPSVYDYGNGRVFRASATSTSIGIFVKNGTAISGSITFKPQLIDLTAMFGSATIPDYLYGLTQANALAWLYKYFPVLNGGYIPYSTPSLQSTCADEHIMDGFNQWDEEWELGSYDNDGKPTSSNQIIRNKNTIRVLPSTEFYAELAGKNARIFYYDISGAFISYYDRTGDGTFTTPANCYFINFRMNTAYGTTYKYDITFNIHWDGERDGEYAPYESHTYAMGHDELRGIYTLDAENNLFLDPTKNDTKSSDGEITRRYKAYTLNGDISESDIALTEYSEYGYTRIAYLPYSSEGVANVKFISDRFVFAQNSDPNSTAGECKNSGSNPRMYLLVPSTVTTKAEAIAWFASNPTTIYAPIATPTTESGTAYTETQWADNWGTEQFTDYAVKQSTRSVPLPVGHVTKYPPDLKAKLEMFPESPDGDGDYIVRQSNGLNSYVPLPNELPPTPTEDGQYKLKAIVSDGVVTPTWVAMQ